MSAADWQDSNNRYLAASLEWLRLVLRRLAANAVPHVDEQPEAPSQPSTSTASAGPATASEGVIHRWFGSKPVAPLVPAKLLPGAKSSAANTAAGMDNTIQQAAAARESAAQSDPPPALVLLAQRLGLSTFERDVLFLCAAMEFDPGIGTLCLQVLGRGYPTFALALSAFENTSWEALAAHRPLRFAHLLEINQPAGVPLTSSPLRADERIVNFIKGLNVLDERLGKLLTPSGTQAGNEEDAPLSPTQEAVTKGILDRLRGAGPQAPAQVIQLTGADDGSRWAVAQKVASTLSRRLYRLGCEALPTLATEVETIGRIWQRESALLPVALYLDAEKLDSLAPEVAAALSRFLAHAGGLVVLGVRDTPARLNTENFTAAAARPSAPEQFEEWVSLLTAHGAKEEAASAAQMLASQFDLNFSEIHAAGAAALNPAVEPAQASRKLWAACREATRPQLDPLAQRLDPKATWDDLMLPQEQTSLMREIVAQVRGRHKVYLDWGFGARMNRGLGINALFTGESGVGKTMAAEVIANDLELNLYRIDLSAVVSKYIGETEKNLRRLFDSAEKGGAILFFDEADALFGKRSEVKDSHDRYANIEINYLLQRMEAFGGLAILATNMKSALDPAFLRRLRFVVNFPFPAVAERKKIWQRAFPKEVPVEALDYDRLARLTITGGNISSIALNAAFTAAQSGRPVTMQTLLMAARTELRKLEKPFNEAEFR